MTNLTKNLPQNSVFSTLQHMIQTDKAYAWSWLCKLAVPMQDEGVDHETSNRIAARIMQNFFDVNMEESSHFKTLEAMWANTKEMEHELEQSSVEEGTSTQQLAFVDSVVFGLDEEGVPCLKMFIRTLNEIAEFRFVDEDVSAFVKSTEVTDINELIGSPCLIEDKDNITYFVEIYKKWWK